MKKGYFQLMILALVLTFVLSCGVVFAEERKDEWKDSKVNFSLIGKVQLETVYEAKVTEDSVTRTKLQDLVDNIFINDKTSSLKKVSMALIDLLSPDNSLPADAKLILTIKQYGTSTAWLPESTYISSVYVPVVVDEIIYDQYRRPHIVKRTKMQRIDKEEKNPASYIQITTAGIEMKMLDNAGKLIWHYVDLRDSKDNKNPYDIMDRIMNKAVERLAEVKK